MTRVYNRSSSFFHSLFCEILSLASIEEEKTISLSGFEVSNGREAEYFLFLSKAVKKITDFVFDFTWVSRYISFPLFSNFPIGCIARPFSFEKELLSKVS